MEPLFNKFNWNVTNEQHLAIINEKPFDILTEEDIVTFTPFIIDLLSQLLTLRNEKYAKNRKWLVDVTKEINIPLQLKQFKLQCYIKRCCLTIYIIGFPCKFKSLFNSIENSNDRTNQITIELINKTIQIEYIHTQLYLKSLDFINTCDFHDNKPGINYSFELRCANCIINDHFTYRYMLGNFYRDDVFISIRYGNRFIETLRVLLAKSIINKHFTYKVSYELPIQLKKHYQYFSIQSDFIITYQNQNYKLKSIILESMKQTISSAYPEYTIINNALIEKEE